MRATVVYTSVVSGGTLTGIVETKGTDKLALTAIVPTSCQIYLKGSHNVTSADFRYIHEAGSQWAWNIGSGEGGIDISAVAGGFTALRIETSVAQTATCSLALIMKY